MIWSKRMMKLAIWRNNQRILCILEEILKERNQRRFRCKEGKMLRNCFLKARVKAKRVNKGQNDTSRKQSTLKMIIIMKKMLSKTVLNDFNSTKVKKRARNPRQIPNQKKSLKLMKPKEKGNEQKVIAANRIQMRRLLIITGNRLSIRSLRFMRLLERSNKK